MTSSTSVSDETSEPLSMGRLLLTLTVALALFLVLDAAMRREQSSMLPLLPHAPSADEVMIMGNSMFKTGIDFQQLAQQLPDGTRVRFNYFNGYYTNLWYLITKNALSVAAEKPRLLVWGFRPTYAIEPAFMVDRVGYVDQFLKPSEPEYDNIVQARETSWQERASLFLTDFSGSYAARNDLQSGLTAYTRRLGASLLYSADQNIDALKIRGTVPTSDLIVQASTQGRVQMTEELVADVDVGQRRFVRGERVSFERSFLPLISDMLQQQEIPQLVVIHKPVSTINEGLQSDVLQFTEAAVAYFERQQIPYLDLIAIDDIGRDDYGSGDHYNAEGRAKVTRELAGAISRVLQELP